MNASSLVDGGKGLGLRERQRIMRRASILSAAGDLFASQGFNEVTLEAVAARAQVSVPTIYSFFKSKHDLLLGLLEEDRRILEPKLARTVEKLPRDPLKAILLIAKMVLVDGYDVSRKAVWREILSASVQLGSEHRNQFRDLLSLTAKHVRLALMRMRQSDTIDPTIDLDSSVRVIHGVIRHIFLIYITNDDATTDDLVAMLAVDLETILLGLAKRAPVTARP